MLYVFDTSSFIVLGHYFPKTFPSFWQRFNDFAATGRLVSVRDARGELDNLVTQVHLREWVNEHRALFLTPTADEMRFVAQIFAIPHFQALISEKDRLAGNPKADPFLIAAAKVKAGCVVTQEKWKANAARIPNVCEHFGIDCVSLEVMMEREGWVF